MLGASITQRASLDPWPNDGPADRLMKRTVRSDGFCVATGDTRSVTALNGSVDDAGAQTERDDVCTVGGVELAPDLAQVVLDRRFR